MISKKSNVDCLVLIFLREVLRAGLEVCWRRVYISYGVKSLVCFDSEWE